MGSEAWPAVAKGADRARSVNLKKQTASGNKNKRRAWFERGKTTSK